MNETFFRLWQSSSVVLLKRAVLRIIHLSRLLRFFVLDALVGFQPLLRTHRSLLVVRLEGIGDYILFRNFLKTLKLQSRFSQHTITLCGNESIRDFALSFDKEVVDDFIWIRPKTFVSSAVYRFGMLQSIRKRGFEVILSPTHSRDTLLGDSIVRCCGAEETIGCYGDDVHARNWERRLFNRWYTTLITTRQSTTFEFLRNKEFFEQLLGIHVSIKKPSLRLESQDPKSGSYVVLCPDALHPKKRWRIEHFLEICDYLFSRHKLTSVLVGGMTIRSSRIQAMIEGRSHVVNHLGKTTLTETTSLVQQSVFVVSNDTGVSHIGVALDKLVIVLSNGEHYGRFTYPLDVYRSIHYAFPPEIAHSVESYDNLVQRYKYGSSLNINSITSSAVIELVDQVLLSVEQKRSASRP